MEGLCEHKNQTYLLPWSVYHQWGTSRAYMWMDWIVRSLNYLIFLDQSCATKLVLVMSSQDDQRPSSGHPFEKLLRSKQNGKYQLIKRERSVPRCHTSRVSLPRLSSSWMFSSARLRACSSACSLCFRVYWSQRKARVICAKAFWKQEHVSTPGCWLRVYH